MSYRTTEAFERSPQIPVPGVPLCRIVAGSFVKMEIYCECGGCGARIKTTVEDGAFSPPLGWSLFDIAVDSLRWYGGTSVQGGFLLCSTCTGEVDDHVTEERSATESEVRAALELTDGDA